MGGFIVKCMRVCWSHEHACRLLEGWYIISPAQVHPSQEYFAVGEKGTNPVIAIYSYPEITLYRVLRGKRAGTHPPSCIAVTIAQCSHR